MRTKGAGAGHGALAAVLAAAIGGVIGIGVDLVGFRVIMPFTGAMLERLQPEGLLLVLVQVSLYFKAMVAAYGWESILINGVSCCGGELVIAAVLGAAGGGAFDAPASKSPREALREALVRTWKARTVATFRLFGAIERLLRFLSG